MTLSVNTNISALNAQLFLQRSSSRFNVSLERLATGLRINRSADDPSGLVISEFQRAQLAGLSTATSNIDRALSLAQTAEGGLSEINGLLTGLRALVIDSANNGALNRDSLEANQENVTSILDTIDRIANTTNFGRQSLLDAASGRHGITSAGTAAAEADFLRSINNDVVVNQNLPIVITQNAERGFVTAAPQAGNLAQDETLVINGIEIQLEAGLSRPQVINRINQFQGQTEVFAIDVGGNRTELRSTIFGDGARVGVVSNVAAAAAGTGFGTAFQSDFGLDVIGTIGAGIAGANGSTAGAAEGLARLLTGQRGEAGSGVTIQLGLVNETDVATAGVTAANNATVTIVDNSRLFHIGAQANDNASLTLPTVRSEALGIGLRPDAIVDLVTSVVTTSVTVGPNTTTTPISMITDVQIVAVDPGSSQTIMNNPLPTVINTSMTFMQVVTNMNNVTTIVTTTEDITETIDENTRTTIDVTSVPFLPPQNIAVFDNPTYVSKSPPTPANEDESENIQQILISQGETFTPFTAVDAVGITTALVGQNIVMIPSLDQNGASLGADLTPAAAQVYRDFVAGGESLFIFASFRQGPGFPPTSNTAAFLNNVFGFNTATNNITAPALTSPLNAGGAAGTLFAGGPASIPRFNATNEITGLPNGTFLGNVTSSSSIYDSPGGSTVAFIEYGAGEVVYLGFDYFNTNPPFPGGVDGGWIEVLERAIDELQPEFFEVTTVTTVENIVVRTEVTNTVEQTQIFTFTENPLTPNLRSIDVRNPDAAQRALRVVDRSIEELSNFRGEVGAFAQNVLATAQSNVRSQFVNLSAAESSLRDTDFTTELTSFINEQVRRDVGTTVLGLANQNPLSIIDLLQGQSGVNAFSVL